MEKDKFIKDLKWSGWTLIDDNNMLSVRDGEYPFIWIAKVPTDTFLKNFSRQKAHKAIVKYGEFTGTNDGAWLGSDARKLLNVIGSPDPIVIFNYMVKNKLWK